MYALKKAYLEITNCCNLSCDFCPSTKRMSGCITPAAFETLATRIRPHTEYLYLHVMGEPLLHPQLASILDCANRLTFRVMVTTNGTLLQQQAALLCANPAVQRISISVHSMEGNGTEVDDYLDHCISFAQRATNAGKRCVFRLWNLDGAETVGANRQNDAILDRLAQSFPRPWIEGRQGLTLSNAIHLEWGERFQWPDLTASEGPATGFCMGLRDQIGVLWDGTVVPCCLDHEGDIPLGNLHENTLAEILDTPRARAIYEGFSRRQPVEKLCRTCGYMRRFH